MRWRFWLLLVAAIAVAGLVVTTCDDEVEREVDRVESSVGPQPADPSAGLEFELAAATTSTTAPARSPRRVVSRSARARSATATADRAEGCTLEVIRRRESGGDYGAVSSSGKYRGAYQFDRQTWASVGGSGDPASAPAEEQDARAAELMRRRGTQPWSVCR